VVRDLLVDAMVPSEWTTPRLLDLDELADALDAGWIRQSRLSTGFAAGRR
jgi:predicted RNA-binding protein associated with RNAse of E/G family